MYLALSNTGSKWPAIIPEGSASAPFSVTHQQFSPKWLRPARMLLAETRGRSTTTGLVDCGPAQFHTSFQIGTAAVTVLCVQSILGSLGSTSLEFSEVCFPRATGGQRSREKQSQHKCQRLLFTFGREQAQWNSYTASIVSHVCGTRVCSVSGSNRRAAHVLRHKRVRKLFGQGACETCK